MVKEGNERIYLTFSKKQAKWLRETSKKLGMTTSNFVKWLIDKNIGHLINRLPNEDLEYLIKICKTKWLDFPTDEYNDPFR